MPFFAKSIDRIPDATDLDMRSTDPMAFLLLVARAPRFEPGDDQRHALARLNALIEVARDLETTLNQPSKAS